MHLDGIWRKYSLNLGSFGEETDKITELAQDLHQKYLFPGSVETTSQHKAMLPVMIYLVDGVWILAKALHTRPNYSGS
ncbi:hypothetical protein Tco_0774175 [Tanacetum coccineum]|uniref:Uncharacterized protein n=1 Tax=Tanacetum coccineum TaxID=301880 RepID=A0ABQ4ZMT7_9ASTR